jgi:hypothetical protein
MPNPGYLTRNKYDNDITNNNTKQSKEPLNYILDTNRIYNNNTCFSSYGPNLDYMGEGVSEYKKYGAQNNIDIDSIMSKRNIKYKKDGVNPINVNNIKRINHPRCDIQLETQYTKITDSPMFSKGVAINRFFTPINNPQNNIFYNWEENTRLTAKDNYVFEPPEMNFQ